MKPPWLASVSVAEPKSFRFSEISIPKHFLKVEIDPGKTPEGVTWEITHRHTDIQTYTQGWEGDREIDKDRDRKTEGRRACGQLKGGRIHFHSWFDRT